jgi:hypothetical protein
LTTEIRRSQRTRRGPHEPKFRKLGDGKRTAPRHKPSVETRHGFPPHLEFLTRYSGTLPEVIRGADLVVLNAGLHFLFAHLREALRLFEGKGDAGRSGAFTALGALWQFVILFEKPKTETLQIPILRLQDALVSLDKNSVSPIVAPTRRRGRGGSSHAHLALKGQVAGAVRRLVCSGVSQTDAHEKVGARLRRQRIRAERGPGHVTAGTVRNWCNEVSSDVSRRGTAAQVYEDMLTDNEERLYVSLSKADARRFALASSRWIGVMFPELRKAT